MTFTPFMGVCLDEIQVVNIPSWASINVLNVNNAIFLEKWHCLCGSSVAYSHHRVCSIGKKKKLARKTSIKDKRSVTIDDDLPNLVCEVQAESWKFRDRDDGQLYCNPFSLKKGWDGKQIKNTILSPNSDYTEESENSQESPHIREIKCIANNVYQVILCFSSARDEASILVCHDYCGSPGQKLNIISLPHLKRCYTKLPLGWDAMHRCMNTWFINAVCMKPTLNGSFALQHFEHGNALKYTISLFGPPKQSLFKSHGVIHTWHWKKMVVFGKENTDRRDAYLVPWWCTPPQSFRMEQTVHSEKRAKFCINFLALYYSMDPFLSPWLCTTPYLNSSAKRGC